jgi:hypothetical protein
MSTANFDAIFEFLDELPPLEEGGVIARIGFSYQDEVAAGYCLQTVCSGATYQEVWCETHDDIALLQVNADSAIFEFVQVKAHELNQFWSIAKLCERKGQKAKKLPGTSILERSIAQDRTPAVPRFRIVTRISVNADLQMLTSPITSPSRNAPGCHSPIVTECTKRLGVLKSKNGRDLEFWVSHCVWEVKGSEDAVRNENFLLLQQFAEVNSLSSTSSQRTRIYERLLTKIAQAAKTRWDIDREGKKIRAQALREWLISEFSGLEPVSQAQESRRLVEKLEIAGLSKVTIEAAADLRRSYLQEKFTLQFGSTGSRQFEPEVLATLQQLRAQLDAGDLNQSGPQFHSRCIEELRSRFPESVPSSMLEGCMYMITGRCRHQFHRPE